MSTARRYPEPRGSIKARVVAAVEGGMNQDDVASIARATGLTVEQVRSALRNMMDPRASKSRAPAPRPSGVRLRVISGTHLEAGPGDRRPECTNYENCLSGWADASNSDAHCPSGCARFEAADVELEFLHLASSRPRAEHVS